ncbi:MAG: polysaccharide deacetylase family protein [Bacteroidota bacterium]
MVLFSRLTLIYFILLLGIILTQLLLPDLFLSFSGNILTIVALSLIVLYAAISLVMVFFPCSQFFHPVICHATGRDKFVALTFDDGPDVVKTPLILDILKRRGVPATFFCIGRKVEANEEVARQIHAAGHLIGNHSFSHANGFGFYSAGRILQELQETDQVIARVTGAIPVFFRPPFGIINPTLHRVLRKTHWQAICWNIRSFDTLGSDPQKIQRRILRKLKPGSIILLHDHTTFSGDHLEGLITAIRDAGYEPVALDKLLNLEAYVQ